MIATKNKKIITILALVISTVTCGVYLWKNHKSVVLREQPTAQIAIVNLSRIRNEAQSFIKFKELIERQYKIFHNEISNTQNELRKKYQEIKELEKTAKKPATELQKRKDDLDHQVAELDKQVRTRKDKLSESFSIITSEIETTIRKIVNNIAHSKHLNLVFNATILDASVVLYSGEELDITDEVLQELDKQLPTVHLPS